ncbi:hypothetical protein PF004_g999 [Phytophthora fragariae]|uniref:Protein kinase domain-containing protein n=1 Tax=Phytophthora fragariae TaxID=53985 RepID=A0A6G0PTT4_9STRA|nr:hypothetical protein PF004_g999 [Phytophthora fragariae]
MVSVGQRKRRWRLCALLLCLLCAVVASQDIGSGSGDTSIASSPTTETLTPPATSPATTPPTTSPGSSSSSPETTSSTTTTPATTPPSTTETTAPPVTTETTTAPPVVTEAVTATPVTTPPSTTETPVTTPPATTEATTTPTPTPPATTEAATTPPVATQAPTTEPTPVTPTVTPEATEAPATIPPTSPPATTAPVTIPTTVPSATTAEPSTPTAAAVVDHYNSSTLPPEVDSSLLNGSELVTVEVTETTLGDGTTSYSYVVITKIGETVKTIVLSPTTSSPTASADDSTKSGSSLSDTNTSAKSSSSLGVGAIVGIIAGTFVFMLVLFVFFIFQRRRSKDRLSEASSDDIFDPAGVEKQVRLLEQGEAMADTEYADVTRTTANSRSSGGSMPDGRRHRATLWEDPVILASRIPIDRIELGTVIGHGAFGEVYRGRYRDQDVAVKMLLPEKRKDMVHIQAFLSEVRIVATMEHPNIVPFIGVAWESLSDLFCVTEFMTGGDLRTLLKDYLAHDVPQGMDATKMQIAYEVAFALTYLHSLQPAMLHRDLKSRNILLTGSLHAKITDFGASRIRSDATMTSNVGSGLWMAPEVMVSGHYGEKADVFSLGVVISELDTHELPYSHAKEDNNSASGRSLPDAAVLQMVSMGKLQVRCSRFMHPEMVRLVEKCVSVNPVDRPTAAEVVYYLQTAIKSRQF